MMNLNEKKVISEIAETIKKIEKEVPKCDYTVMIKYDEGEKEAEVNYIESVYFHNPSSPMSYDYDKIYTISTYDCKDSRNEFDTQEKYEEFIDNFDYTEIATNAFYNWFNGLED